MEKQIIHTVNGSITCINFKVVLVHKNEMKVKADLVKVFPRLKRFIVEVVYDEIVRLPFNLETGELLDGDTYRIEKKELERIKEKFI